MSLAPGLSSRALLDFFSRALASFQGSKDAFQIICSLPHGGLHGSSEPFPKTPLREVRSLVILDSSFNPPTLAHMRMAKSAVESIGKGDVRLLLLLAVNNADKAAQPAAFPVRLAMMFAFARDLISSMVRESAGGGNKAYDAHSNVGEAVDTFDIDLGLTTMPYFPDKSQAISESGFYELAGSSSETEQVYLAGYDTLIRIFNPKYYTATSPSESIPIRAALTPFFQRSRLRITMRTDADWGGRSEQLAYLEELRNGGLEKVGGKQEWGHRVEMVDGRGDNEEVVSSTKVRDAVRKGDVESLRRLVGPGVRDWVLQEHLYGDESSQ